MGITLTNKLINDTYDGLIKTTDNQPVSNIAKKLTDGFGNDLPIEVSDESIIFTDVADFTSATVLGIEGLAGAQGPQGYQGPIGMQGADGTDGTDGAQGFQGVQGPAGQDGTDGTDGVDGAQGPQGFQGPIGLQGADGTDGTDGLDGATGPQGPEGVVSGDYVESIQGLTGSIIFNEGTHINIQVEPDNSITISSSGGGGGGTEGPQGPQGFQGPQGPVGQNGTDGTDGLDGAQGFQGVQGPVGQNGTDGVDGATGPQGPEGIVSGVYVESVNGLTGSVTLTTTNISEGTNLYFTTTRVNDVLTQNNIFAEYPSISITAPNYLLSSSDEQRFLICDNPSGVNIQVPAGLSRDCEIILYQANTGPITIIAGNGVIINNTLGYLNVSSTQYAVIAIKQLGVSNSYVLTGERKLS